MAASPPCTRHWPGGISTPPGFTPYLLKYGGIDISGGIDVRIVLGDDDPDLRVDRKIIYAGITIPGVEGCEIQQEVTILSLAILYILV